MDTIGQIRAFVQQEILEGDDSISDETPLLDGLVDSFSLMQLVSFLEETFGIELDEGAITTDNFRTVSEIGQLVQRVRGAA